MARRVGHRVQEGRNGVRKLSKRSIHSSVGRSTMRFASRLLSLSWSSFWSLSPSFDTLVTFCGIQRFASTPRGRAPSARKYCQILFVIIDEGYRREFAASPTFPLQAPSEPSEYHDDRSGPASVSQWGVVCCWISHFSLRLEGCN